ncbi:Similar to RSPH3: Radial spoke head protein 3 homolog (Homo sapiens) [Cotesia congregata]|uniref:Similar to RSPH3: Radial spoke head protein 3 homolog (Homo sapiens) n=1 Tax=Cotesia congregata TaxID=51543 RepID=A0A8J2HM75_COTCN|nr:Similar to RSPH3: Radial spoke head protein 3 homolog (Homo sapiens) [Cotesia congregata]
MPAGLSSLPPSSFDYNNYKSPAFMIIHRDHLDSTLPILHINNFNSDDNDNDNYNNEDCKYNNKKSYLAEIKNEKNNFLSRKRISKSNDHLVLANLQNNQVNPLKKKQVAKSHDQLVNNDDKKPNDLSSGLIGNKLPMNLTTEDFSEVLTDKFKDNDRQLISSSKSSNKTVNCNNNNNNNNNINVINNNNKQSPQKKPFITTVKTGEFLLPPPEVASLLGMAPNGSWIGHDLDDTHEGLPRSRFRPFVFRGKRPEVRHSSHNARCPAALKATVDFPVNVVNSSGVTASTLANEVRSRKALNNKLSDTDLPWTSQALPKKLEPLKNTMHVILNNDGDQSLPFANIMFDRRVVRGSTYASASNIADCEQSEAARQAEARRKQIYKKRAQIQATRSMMMRISSPPPVPGRKHEPVQTDLYLEELLEKPQESEAATQTDYFLDRPSTPLHCPVLVGKTIEQALIEVLEEEELAALKEQQRRFRELRGTEKVEKLRLEEQERRLREEKEQRLKQHEEALKIQEETEERVAAAVLLTGYVAELLPSVLDRLKISGYLLQEIKEETEEREGFMPLLVSEVKKEVGTMVDSTELLEDIIKEILKNKAEVYQKQAEDYEEESIRSPVTPKNSENEEINEEEESNNDSNGENLATHESMLTEDPEDQ